MELRELTREDCEYVRQWRNESLVSLRTPYRLTREMQSDFYDNVICNRDSPHKYWGICPGIQEYICGMGGITNIQWENSIGEISLIICPKNTGIGYGTKAVDLLLDKAFNFMGLKTVFGECYLCNSAVSFWEKITEKYNGTKAFLPNRKFWDGDFYQSLYFSIDKDKFNNVKNKSVS